MKIQDMLSTSDRVTVLHRKIAICVNVLLFFIFYAFLFERREDCDSVFRQRENYKWALDGTCRTMGLE